MSFRVGKRGSEDDSGYEFLKRRQHAVLGGTPMHVRGDIQEPVADGIGRLAVMKVHRKYFWG